MENEFSKKQLLVTTAIRHLLRPVVKLMLAHNITYTLITDVLKSLYVEVAESDFAISSKKQTDSRISLISGVHRKDVKRLRMQRPSVGEVMPHNVSLGAQVIALWNAHTDYTDADGVPKPLPRYSADGGQVSFESLVKSVSTDIHPRAVLDEWLWLGIAHVDAENVVHLTTEAFVPQVGFEEKMFYLEHNLHDHVAASVHNVLGDMPPYFERSVHYDGLSELDIAALQQMINKNGMKVLREVNKTAEVLSSRHADNQGKQRMTFGIYFYHTDDTRSIKK